MKLLLEQASEAVNAQGPGFIQIAGQRYEHSLILLPDRVLAWEVPGFASLTAEHFAALAAQGAPLTLIGTGEHQRFPSPALLRPLIEAGRGFEIMSTAAACRTWNILSAEGRDVCAALIVET